jgi:hypothetical protein
VGSRVPARRDAAKRGRNFVVSGWNFRLVFKLLSRVVEIE